MPEQDDGCPDGQFAVELHGEGVHRDGADDRARLAADADLGTGERALESIRVADGHDPDPRRLLRDEAPAVAGALTRLQLLDLSKEALPGEDGLEDVVGRVAVERREPVDRAAAPHRVEVRLGEAQRRSAVRRVTGEVAVLLRRRAKAFELCAGEVGVAVGSRQMRHQAHYLGGR